MVSAKVDQMKRDRAFATHTNYNYLNQLQLALNQHNLEDVFWKHKTIVEPLATDLMPRIGRPEAIEHPDSVCRKDAEQYEFAKGLSLSLRCIALG